MDMDETTPKRRWWQKKRWWVAIILAAELAYPLGAGPAVYACSRGWLSVAAYTTAYSPLYRFDRWWSRRFHGMSPWLWYVAPWHNLGREHSGERPLYPLWPYAIWR